jgi:hypothetical protein
VKRPMHLRHGDRKYDFSDLEGATDAEVQREIAEIRQGADRLTREAEIQALMKSRLGQTQKSCAPITIQTLGFWQTMDSATSSFTALSYACRA